METRENYQRLEIKAGEQSSFYRHLSIFIGVIFLLLIINLSISADYLWVKWPLFGWGIAVCWHALIAFVFTGESSTKTRSEKK